MAEVNNTQPLYIQIKEFIKEQLNQKVYDVGDILPAELEFQKQFGVSRITVRNAINELVNEGYLTRTRGKGTTVVFQKLNETISHTRSFTEEMQSIGLTAVTKTVELSIVKADSFISQYLGVAAGCHVLRIQRLRGVAEYPIGFFDTYFAIDRNMPIDKDLYRGSLYETIKTHCGIDWKTDIFRMTDHFESIRAEAEIAKKLEIKTGEPILKRISQTCDKNKQIFEFTLCYYRADKYSCTITYL